MPHSISPVKHKRKIQKIIPSANTQGNKIFELIKLDHVKIQSLCQKLLNKKAASHDNTKLHETFNKLKELISTHVKAEEKVLYSEVVMGTNTKNDTDGYEQVLEAFEEHKVAGMLLNEMSQIGVADERFMAKMKVLSEALDHHIEEEESLIFKIARKDIEKDIRAGMAKKFVEEKQSIQEH